MLSDTKGDLSKKTEIQSENKQNDDIECELTKLTHSFPMLPFSTPWKR